MWTIVATSFLFSATGAFRLEDGVKTTSGLVRGHMSGWQPSVVEYLGIPYAKPPLGPLRFRAPVAYTSNRTLWADKFSLDCPANVQGLVKKESINSARGVVMASLSQFGDELSEDCLTLNIWSNQQSGEKSKAVLVWIYGGGFALGNTASPTYNGARLAADEDVVVVSMNYRLNIFGFPNAPGLSEQNLGLRDQRLAIEWIRDNVAAFGGDPKRITLFGESAGGASVDYYSFAYTNDPIVNGFIPQSGTALLGDLIGGGNSSNKWYQATQKLGCGGAEAGEKTVDCMRQKPWKDILDAIKPAGSAASLGGMGDFGPSADGKIVFSDYRARMAAGKFIKKPMFVGNNKNEIALFLVILNQTSLIGNPLLSMTGGIFGCPSGQAAKARVDNKVKAWRYLYSGEWPNQEIYPRAGSWHGSELGMVFGSTEYQQNYYSKQVQVKIDIPDTDEQKKLAKTMMHAWASFAKDPENGLQKEMNWPVYDATGATIIELGGPNSAKVGQLNVRAEDSSCGLVSMMAGMLGPNPLAALGNLGNLGKSGSGNPLGALGGFMGGSSAGGLGGPGGPLGKGTGKGSR